MFRFTLRFFVTLLAIFAVTGAAQAQFTLASPTTAWTVVPYPASTTTDFHLDQQTGSGEADIVGGGQLPSFYTKLVPGANNTTGTLSFRVRLGADDSPAGFKAACFLGVDANADGKLDLFFGVNNSGGSDGLYIWKAGTGANTSPSTTSIDTQNPVFSYAVSAANYLWVPVDATIDPGANTAALRNLDGRTGGDQTDRFVNWSMPFADIVSAFQTVGITVNSSTPLNYVVGTATQANSFNQDLNGVNGGTSSSLTWAQLGALSLTLNSSGTPVLAPPVITSATTASGTYNAAFSYQITATNTPTSYNATGLPPGVTVNTTTGLISGTPTTPGTYTVTISATNADGTGTATLTITIPKATQTITFAALAAATYGDPTRTLTATASSGLAVSYTLLSGPASLSGNVVTITGVGTVSLRASQSGNANYDPAADVDRSFTVGQAVLSVRADNLARPVGDPNPPLTATISGFVNGENLATSGVTGEPALSTTATPASPAGAYPISVSIGTLAAANYSFTFTAGTLTVGATGQTITFPAIADTTYGAAPITLAATASSGLPVSYTLVSGPASLSGNVLTITGADTVLVRASQAGDSSYAAAADVDRNFAVAKAALTVTADDKARAYGAADPTFTATFSNFVNGENLASSGVTGTPALSTTATPSSAVGTYPITAALGTLAAANYSFTFTAGTLTVSKASQTITFPALADTTYGAAPITLAATASSGSPVSYTVVSGPASLSGNSLTITGAGTVLIRASQPGDSNYDAATDVDRSFAVAKAALTVTADDKARAYGAANPTLTASFANFVNSETLATSGVTGSPALSTTAQSNSPAGPYPITAASGSLAASNYSFTFTTGTLTVGFVNQAPTFDLGANPEVAEDSGPQTIVGFASAISPGAADESGQALTFQLSNNNSALFAVQPTLGANGTLTFTPARDAQGTATVTVVLRDDGGTANGGQDTSVTKTFAITVTPVNDAPVAVTDLTATTGENPVTIEVLANDRDVDGEAVLFVGATLKSGSGTIVSTPGGEVTFTPAPGFRGQAVIDYEITDAAGAKTHGLCIVTVNAPPLAAADVASTVKNTAVQVPVLANDVDADASDVLTITQVAVDGAFGTASVSGDGTSITFTPATDLIGTVQFRYTIGDGRGGYAQATVTVTIGNAVADLPPIARSDRATTTPATQVSISVLANDSDPENGALTIGRASVEAIFGTVTISGQSITFQPASGFTGVATIDYAAVDAAANAAEAIALVEVSAGQAPPIALNDTGRAQSGVAKNFTVLTNDLAPDGGALTVTNATLTNPASGSVSVNPNGTLSFTPAANFVGTIEISYIIEDASGQRATAQLSVEVFASLTNSAPAAVNDTFFTQPGDQVSIQPLANDLDADGDPLTLDSASVAPAVGTVTISPNGTIIFTLAPGFSGVATITYRISDPDGATSDALISVIVNTPPVAAPDLGKTTQGQAIAFNVLTNDTDADGHALNVAAFTGDPLAGQLSIAADGALVFTPTGTFTGEALFSYTLADELGAIVEGQIVIMVNDPPVAMDNTATTDIVQPISVNVLGNDSDPNGDEMRIVAATVDASQGTVTIQEDGTLLFTPAPTFRRAARIRYLVSDSHGAVSSAELSISRGNAAPTTAGRTVYCFCNVALSINSLRGAGDADGDSLRVVSVTQPRFGTVRIGGNGYVTFLPGTAFNDPKRTDSFTVTVEDSNGGISTMTVLVAAFNSLKGTYQSLITDPAEASQALANQEPVPLAGQLTLTMGNAATFSGVLQLGAQRHGFLGRLAGALTYERKLVVNGFPNAKLKLTFRPDTKKFSAEITGLNTLLTAANGLEITAKRHTISGRNFAGSYRADLRSIAQTAGEVPLGDFLVKISTAGVATYRGILPDGRVVTGSSRLFGTGQLPLYRAFAATGNAPRGYVGGTTLLDMSNVPPQLTGTLLEDFGAIRELQLEPSTSQ